MFNSLLAMLNRERQRTHEPAPTNHPGSKRPRSAVKARAKNKAARQARRRNRR